MVRSLPWLLLFAALPLLARANPTPSEAVTLRAVHPALPPLRPGPQPDDALAPYRVPAGEFALALGPARALRRHAVREVEFPSARAGRWPVVHGTLYLPTERAERVPAAVVVHHLGGSFDAEKVLAQHLAVNGVAALFVSLPNYGARREPGTREGFLSLGPEVGFATFQQAVLDVIRAGDALRALPEVDPERVGLVGVSLGAFVTAVARGVDPRLGRTALLLGGGDLPGLLAALPEEIRRQRPEGLELEALTPLLRPVDPLTFAARIEPDDVYMVNARRDEIVPEASTLALWERLERPRIEWLDCGHYGIVLHMPRLFNTVLDHLRGEVRQDRSPDRRRQATSQPAK